MKQIPFLVVVLVAIVVAAGGPLHAVQDPEREALEQYLSTGEAPILALPGERRVPYGEKVPRITCQPYRACSIQLAAGETIIGRAVGDTERWGWAELPGSADGPLIVVKPTEYDLITNAVIQTEERIYRLELYSPPAAMAAEAGYDSLVSWYYPADWAVARAADAQAAQTAAAEDRHRRAVPSAELQAVRLEELHTEYRVDRPLLRRLRWEPELVLDDGLQTLVRLPWEAQHREPPVALGVLDGEEAAPLNARLDPTGKWLIVPAVVDRLRLVSGNRSLTLVREGDRD